MNEPIAIEKLIISAPFGNWFNWPHCTSTVGSYTSEFRAGWLKRLWRVLATVRYYPGIQAWKNKLGLPNPGIDALVKWNQSQYSSVATRIVSVSARRTLDWLYLIDMVSCMRPLALEANVSCPNTPGEVDESDYAEVFRRAAVCGTEVIVKLPPVNYEKIFALAVSQGILSFHCCNTLPTPGGGLSGKPLKPLSLACIRHIKSAGKLNRIIGGGGITCGKDVAEYLDAGATNVAVASALFNPFAWQRLRKLAQTLRYGSINAITNA